MALIIPALLVNDVETFRKRLRQIEGRASLVQIDVTDGKFVPYVNFADPEEIKKISAAVDYEIHLMVENPEQQVDSWLKMPQVKRVIFHVEAASEPEKVIEKIKRAGRAAGLALNPTTPIKKITPFLPLVDFVLVLGVTPGRSGQPFQKKIFKKIAGLRRLAPEVEIEVDGGMTQTTIKEALAAGANAFAAAGAIWGKGDPWENLKQLQQIQP